MREAIRRLQRSSEVIRGHQAGLESLEEEDHLMREAIRGHSESNPRPFGGTQRALRGHSEGAQRALRGRSEGAQRALRGHSNSNPRPSEAIRGTHLLDGSKAEPFNRLALPRRQRGLELDRARLEDAEGHGDKTRVGLEPVPASFGMHPHAVRPVLNQGHLRRGAITRNQTPSEAPSAPSARWAPCSILLTSRSVSTSR